MVLNMAGGLPDQAREDVAVVAVPFPAQGHLNQLLHFCLHISSYAGVSVHYACSAVHNRQAKDRIQGWDAAAVNRIRFHDLESPPFHNPSPDPEAGVNFPVHLQPAFESSVNLLSPLSSLLRSISASVRRVVVVHDPLMPFASHEAAALPNAESYRFLCAPAFTQLAFIYERGSKKEQEVSRAFSHFDGCFSQAIMEFTSSLDFTVPAEAGVLMNTSRAIEDEFINSLAEAEMFADKIFFTVGPVNPLKLSKHHECLGWLDKQPPASVVYVAFGSTVTFSDRQLKELAEGLKLSGQRFIWVLKEADRGNIYANEEKSSSKTKMMTMETDEEVGLILRGWAPQLEILEHKSTAAFMSHCGWNSCMESLAMGVPVMAWPVHSDQPSNAELLTEYLKVGVLVREWHKRAEIVSAKRIAEVIKMVVVEEEGKKIREKAKVLGEAVRSSVEDGGSSRKDLESFVAYITR